MLIGRKKITDWKNRIVPFALTPFIMLADQLVKAEALRTLPPGRVVPVIGDLLRFVLFQNTAIGFSIGRNLPAAVQRPLFIALNVVVVAAVVLYSLFTRDNLTGFQRWCLAAIVGGGLGNNIDRIFRPAGVVDFVQMKVFGLFGMEYWPVYNLSDATLVISGILLVISFLLPQKKPSSDDAGAAAPGGKP
jgi:signal peptidase II